MNVNSAEQKQTSTQVGSAGSGANEATHLRNNLHDPIDLEAQVVDKFITVEVELLEGQGQTLAIQTTAVACTMTRASIIAARSTRSPTPASEVADISVHPLLQFNDCAQPISAQGVVRAHLTVRPLTTPTSTPDKPRTLTHGGGTEGPGRSPVRSIAGDSSLSGPDPGGGFNVQTRRGQESDIAIAKLDQTSATSTSANVKSDSVSLLVPDLDDLSSEGDLDTDSEEDLDSDRRRRKSRLSSAIRFLQLHRLSIFRFREKVSSQRTSPFPHAKNLRRSRTPTPNSSNFVAGLRQSSVPQQMSWQL